jgi:predicted protein tyrosine phosphatase
MLHVCSLAHLPGTVQATGASHVITVMADVAQVRRPPSIREDNHLVISMDDIRKRRVLPRRRSITSSACCASAAAGIAQRRW